MLDLVNRKVLIFGGGDVGARKAAYFEHEAEVIVISRSFSPALDALAIERQEMDLSTLPDGSLKDLLKDAFLAVAATSDPRLNDRMGDSALRPASSSTMPLESPAISPSRRSSGAATTWSRSAPAEKAPPCHATFACNSRRSMRISIE